MTDYILTPLYFLNSNVLQDTFIYSGITCLWLDEFMSSLLLSSGNIKLSFIKVIRTFHLTKYNLFRIMMDRLLKRLEELCGWRKKLFERDVKYLLYLSISIIRIYTSIDYLQLTTFILNTFSFLILMKVCSKIGVYFFLFMFKLRSLNS